MPEQETDVVVIGSGFGGSVAALRFAERGFKVVVLERGDYVTRESFHANASFFWSPKHKRYGFHDFEPRGKPIIPWLGAAVGGGSHVYAGTLKRRDDWEGFPHKIRNADMGPYHDKALAILGGGPLPDWEPYASIRATKLMYRAGARLKTERPDLVEDWGPVHLAVSFAPKGVAPGTEFVNEHGCMQRYYDPQEQSLLGGDIDAKNTLDKNYLFLAARAEEKADIRPLSEAATIERESDGKYRVDYARHKTSGPRSIRARCVVVAAGSIGSTELLLRNKLIGKTLPSLSDALGTRYSTNGDFITLLIPFRGFFVSWTGFLGTIVALCFHSGWTAIAGLVVYYAGVWMSPRPYDPDVGTTNSDNIRFRGRDGRRQGAYIEGGRYPTPGGILSALVITVLTGHFRPRAYRWIHRIGRGLRAFVPPFGALARSWPIPLLSMGKDEALGTFKLDATGRAVIDYDVRDNRAFYAYLTELGRLVARAVDAYWLPDIPYMLTRRMEVPHNLGGVPMGESKADGVVDHAGRVFGAENLMVLDGSIIPVAVGPNPALTIAAIAERGVEIAIDQLEKEGSITAEEPS